MSPEALTGRVKAMGRRLGFDLVTIGPPEPPEHGSEYEAWLDAGYAATMVYLERSRAKRLDPRLVLPEVRAVVACALNHYQGRGAGPSHIARYAWGADYHQIMQPRLSSLLADLQAAAPGTLGRVYVDTGPLLERELAARSGLGWVGKNTMLLHPVLGSYFLIGVILTSAELAFDTPMPDRCGSCTRCLAACPTAAFRRPYVLDARRCISYLTIENRCSIPAELRASVGTLAFGCDVCQAVCPWNRRAPTTSEPAFLARDPPSLRQLIELTDDAYRGRLRGSPLRRAGRRALRRNAAVALGNSGDPEAIPALVQALGDPDPELRRHAAWGLGRAGDTAAGQAVRVAWAREGDPDTKRELEMTLRRLAEGRTARGDRCDP